MPGKLKDIKIKPSQRPDSVWTGPDGVGPNGGITFSLLSRFLVCRERFRLLVVEGLKPVDEFLHRIEYGQMWHVCEEAHAQGEDWLDPLREYASALCNRYPMQQQQVQHWYNVCIAQFPEYLYYWSSHQDTKKREPLLQEHSFDVLYELPDGRVVRLRGKWDSVDSVGSKIWLQENKSKGDIDEQQIKRQLSSDLQTMMYVTALRTTQRGVSETGMTPDWLDGDTRILYPIAGVRYNVVRRPLSGGKHTIRQHKPTKSNPTGESEEEFYGRLKGLIAGEPEFFFMRWNVGITQRHIDRFCRRSLDPILMNLCDWWEDVRSGSARFTKYNYVHPHGIWNALNEGRASELDEYLSTGSEIGLQHTDSLFPELA